jgi:hypothetical protein
VKFMGCNMYRKKTHRWTEWPRGQSEYKHNNNNIYLSMLRPAGGSFGALGGNFYKV